MSCAVNLVPVSRLQARQRARHRQRWVVAGVVSAALVAGGWAVQQAGSRALNRLTTEAGSLDQQRVGVQRDLAQAAARRDELLGRLTTIAEARRPQPWPERLVTLTREAPPALFLTQFEITDPAMSRRHRAASTPRGTAVAGDTDGASAPPEQVVRMTGYALDHGALLQFVNTLQGLPGWRQVELVRATLEPYRSGQAIAFELDCRAAEGSP